MLSFFKKLLNLENVDLGERANRQFEQDIETYTSMVANSAKYADSNSNTEAIERLIKALTIEENNAEPTKLAESNKIPAPTGEEPNKKVVFHDLVVAHSDLLKHLDGDKGQILPGQPLKTPERFGKPHSSKNFVLRQFRIPKFIYDAIEANNVGTLRLGSLITRDNYIDFFQTLLWVEEAHQAIEMHRYDMKGVMLGKYNHFFIIDIPGLAEGRPSLMKGDRCILKSLKRESLYEGYIHDVRKQDILVKLHESLHNSDLDGLQFDVSFLSSRTTYRRAHHGVLQYSEHPGLADLIFPIPRGPNDYSSQLIPLESDDPCKLNLIQERLNIYQRRAIMNVLKAHCRPAPYIIFGPPGTGKTVTLVEAVLQVYRRTRFQILVCANSNSAADLCAMRILDSQIVPREDLTRVSAFYRMENLIPPELQDVTADMSMVDGTLQSNSRIIVATCSQSGALEELGCQFDYVFIDEAGHATEPEALISISLLKNGGCCVLAGDHQQLGPVCMSKVAEGAGLGLSLMERLTRRAVYMRAPRDGKMLYDERYLAKLIISYRSDARLMVVNNELFYDNELKFINRTPMKWMKLLGLEKPLVFHNVIGRDRREYLNPSWFNPNEAIRCLTYAKKLYDAGLQPRQLGIITPYRRQIEKLQILFDSCGMRRCKIATMEEFQGDEREVILISTVRASDKNVKYDARFQLGFLFNPKRFNVAVSRAKWLVIVIGDSTILSRDNCWSKFMKEAQLIEDKQNDKEVI